MRYLKIARVVAISLVIVNLAHSSEFPATINPMDLTGENGFQLRGVSVGHQAGTSVSHLGDVNGDGVSDLIIGAPNADFNANPDSGSCYVVFGSHLSFGSILELSDLDGSNGFRIDGVERDLHVGRQVGAAGDINDDGIDDIIIGVALAEPNGNAAAGSTFVVFGRDVGFPAVVSLLDLDGSNGFRIDGVAEDDQSGLAIAGVGDVNGDEIDDLIIGAPFADPKLTRGIGTGANGGSSYVVFGRSTPFAPIFSLSSLDGSNGFRIDGGAEGEWAGTSVAKAGDVNSDNISDVFIGSRNGSPAVAKGYVVFGRITAFSSQVSLSELDGSNGFSFVSNAPAQGFSGVFGDGAGDINGDGIDDFIFGVPQENPNAVLSAGSSYVLFGRATPFAASLVLASLDGSDGFRIDGIGAFDQSGRSVSDVGDMNGDGIDDLVVGAHNADINGQDSGGSYVVFGKRGGFGATLPLTSLDGRNGFRLEGGAAFDYLGRSVSGAGDINGDGLADLIVGSLASDPNGLESGGAIVLFGRDAITVFQDGFE